MENILVIQTASIGDVILATPVLEKLHRFFPGSRIDLLVKKGNEGLFTGHPFLHEVLVWDKRSRSTRNFIKMMMRVRKRKYSLVVNLQRFFKTGILTALSGAATTIGFDKNPVSFLFTTKVIHKLDGVHEVDRNLSLVAAITGEGRPMPRLYPSTSDTERTSFLKRSPYYTMSPASLWFTKQYPPEKWIELVKQVPQNVLVYLLGAGNDQPLCDDIVKKSGHPGVISLAGKLTFLESAALMSDARMNFTNDSAPMHLASAVNAPVTAIYCSTVPGFGFGPLSVDSVVVEVEKPLPCRPCGLHGYRSCPEKHFMCAWNIGTGQLTSRF
ncbi:MAG: glycosyltransferase family 9 protein [Bacteroidota bacterium]